MASFLDYWIVLSGNFIVQNYSHSAISVGPTTVLEIPRKLIFEVNACIITLTNVGTISCYVCYFYFECVFMTRL